MRSNVRITDLLRSVDLFQDLSSDELDELSYRMRERSVRPGEVVGHADQPNDHLLVVIDGVIEEITDAGSSTRPPKVRRIGSGECVGETALISGAVSSATATAMVETRALELHKDDFDALVAARPSVMRSILAAISRRAVKTNQRLLTEDPKASDSSSTGTVCAVFSPRGGSGKTLLATRLALRLAERMPRRVALLDLDLLFDDAAFQLGVEPILTLAGLAKRDSPHLDPRVMSDLVTEHPSGLRVVVGASTPEEGELVGAAHVREALAALRRQFLVTLVDCGSSFSEPTLGALEAAERVLVVCTPELTTLRDLRECQRIFGQALHLDPGRIVHVLNHPHPVVGLTRRQFEDTLEQSVLLEISHAGEAAARSSFTREVDRLASELWPLQEARVERPRLAFLARGSHAR